MRSTSTIRAVRPFYDVMQVRAIAALRSAERDALRVPRRSPARASGARHGEGDGVCRRQASPRLLRVARFYPRCPAMHRRRCAARCSPFLGRGLSGCRRSGRKARSTSGLTQARTISSSRSGAWSRRAACTSTSRATSSRPRSFARVAGARRVENARTWRVMEAPTGPETAVRVASSRTARTARPRNRSRPRPAPARRDRP